MISVIMGVYNCENRRVQLVKSVQSIVDQTYKDWELIICNDGSTDSTINILHEIKKSDSRIKIISYDKNRGLAYALNECIKHSKGDYIARQDDDDLSDPKRLEIEMKFLDDNLNYDFVGSISDLYDNAGIYGEYKLKERPLKWDFLWNSPFIHPTILFRKSALVKVNGYRIAPETIRCEDYDLFMRLYSVEKKGYNIQSKLYKYYLDRKNDKIYRPMSIRINEALVRLKGFIKLKLYIVGIPFVFKPIILGLFPLYLMNIIQRKKFNYTRKDDFIE